jgi:hypothetical protein
MSRLVLLLLGSPLLASLLLLADKPDTGGPPSTILVVGHTYRVYFVAQGETREGRHLELGAHGDTFTRARLILVEKGLDHDLTRHILFHEIGHACYYEHLRSGNRPIALNQDAYTTEEEAVSSISNEMWQVIRDNPAFVRWLEQKD